MHKPRPSSESGYALLMVLAMAAVVAIMLYLQAPSVSFEAQRDREQLLIDRGEQYKRAVELFVRRFNRYPASLDELESTNNQRFLRGRYPDPMTGDKDWRIVHAGPGGVLLDSVTTPKKSDSTEQVNNGFALPGLTDSSAQSAGAANLATRRTDAASDPLGLTQVQAGAPGYTGPVTVGADGRLAPAVGAPGASGADTPALPAQTTAPAGAATDLINRILTSPRPGGPPPGVGGGIVDAQGNPVPGAPGFTGAPGPGRGAATTTAAQPATIGGGIAGVASKRTQEGIKTYNQRTAYNEWEFVYVPANAARTAAGAPGATGARPSASPQPAMPPGMPPTIMPAGPAPPIRQ